MLKTTRFLAIAACALSIAIPELSHAAFLGDHPAYLHALSDLRAARWLIQHRHRESGAGAHEVLAVRQIDAAVYDIQQAAFDDGKDPDARPRTDGWPDDFGKLRAARDLLYRARHDVTRDEDNEHARNARHWGVEHIDAAIAEVDAAILEAS